MIKPDFYERTVFFNKLINLVLDRLNWQENWEIIIVVTVPSLWLATITLLVVAIVIMIVVVVFIRSTHIDIYPASFLSDDCACHMKLQVTDF